MIDKLNNKNSKWQNVKLILGLGTFALLSIPFHSAFSSSYILKISYQVLLYLLNERFENRSLTTKSYGPT